MKKIALLCLALVLALGALGVGYASWTDTIFVSGTVCTGDVDINVVDYSGTWIYKVPGDFQSGEIWIYHGWATVPFQPPAGISGYPAPFEVAYAVALPNGEDAVDVTFYNAFPCSELRADILVHYEGSIPAMVDAEVTAVDPPDCALAEYAEVHFYVSDAAGFQGAEILSGPVQMHDCDYVLAVMSLDLPQDDTLQDLCCTFTAEITATQWNECLD